MHSPTQREIGITTTVDSLEAAYYLEHYLAGTRADAALDVRIDHLHQLAAPGRLPNRSELAVIASDVSTDFSALFFADRVVRDRGNAAFHARFKHHLDNPAEAGFDLEGNPSAQREDGPGTRTERNFTNTMRAAGLGKRGAGGYGARCQLSFENTFHPD